MANDNVQEPKKLLPVVLFSTGIVVVFTSLIRALVLKGK